MKRVATVVVAAALSVPLIPSQPAARGQGAPPAGGANRVVPEGKFSGVGLGDAIDFIRDVSGANIVVNWKALAEANVTPDTVVTARLYNVSVRKVLNVILNEASGGNDQLTFEVSDGVIEITTRAIADQRLVTRVYPIQDLLLDVPDFTDAPNFDLTTQGQQANSTGGGQGGGGGGGGGSGSTLFGPSGQNNQEKEKIKTKDERGQEIVDLITSTIRPDVWRDNGGPASIKYFNGNLIISAPASVHELIGQ